MTLYYAGISSNRAKNIYRFFEWDVTTDSLVPNTLLAEGPFGPLSLSAGFYPTSSHFMNFIDGFGDNLQISFT